MTDSFVHNDIVKGSLLMVCREILEILSLYYHFQNTPDISPFLLPPSKHLNNHGRLIIETDNNELFLGIEFAENIYIDLNSTDTITPHQLAVIAEEMSHFHLFYDAFHFSTPLSHVEMEFMGEIDRFLILMHWDHFSNRKLTTNTWSNLSKLCDFVFLERTFTHSSQTEVYLKAETIALKQLQYAFQAQWDHSQFDFSKISWVSRERLSSLRNQILGQSVRRAA